MTETAVLELEQAADPLDEVISSLAAVVMRLRSAAGVTPSPAALTGRASTVRALADTLMRLPLRLLEDANRCDAKAAAVRTAGEASAVLADAEAAAGAAQDAYDATAEPEQAAARKAITARQLAEQAADTLGRAEQDGTEPALLAELHWRVRDAEAVLRHEAGKLASAQAGRQAAREVLDRAWEAHRQAQEDLAAVEATAEHPTAASLTRKELLEPLMFSFPVVLFGEDKLTADQMAVCRYHATAICDDFGWVPPKAEARIRQDMAAEMIATARQGRAVEIGDGKGTVRLVANPLGQMGASQVATVAQAR